MNKVIGMGTAIEAGRQRGKQMLEKKVFQPQLYRAVWTKKRESFALACERDIQRYDPGVIAQLQGMSDVLQVPYEELRTFLFGMYAFNEEIHCSCIAQKDANGIYLGRNSDFLRTIAPYCLMEQMQIEEEHCYLGNTTAFLQLEDGVNEAGLAIGLTYVRPHNIQPGFHAGLLLRYLLAHCTSVTQACEALRQLPIATSQTLTMIDRDFHMAMVECNCEKIAIRYETDCYATNTFHLEAMKPFVMEETLADLHSEERYQTLKHAAKKEMNVPELKNLLQGKHGFLCQYPPECPADTIWSIIYDPCHAVYDFCDGNPMNTDYQSYRQPSRRKQ